MTDLYEAADTGDLRRVRLLLEQEADKNQIGGKWDETALSASSKGGHLAVVQYLVIIQVGLRSSGLLSEAV